MTEARLNLSLPPRADLFASVRDILGEFADLVGADGATSSAVQLSVHEAAANVVEHARIGDEGFLRVTAEADGSGCLRIVVADATTIVLQNGARESFEMPDEHAEGGRGLPVMEALAEELELRRNAGTEVELTFAVDQVATDGVRARSERDEQAAL